MINVSVVDNHPILREGIKKVINATIDMNVSSEASNWAELQPVLLDDLPDIVVLEINVSGQNGFDIIEKMQETVPQVPILILSVHPEQRYAVKALKAGAMGYLNKAALTEKLVKAIRRIYIRKRKYFSSEIAEQMPSQMNGQGAENPQELLSAREYQVLCKIAAGKKTNAIAAELSLSKQTVYTYRAKIKEKLGLHTNVDMVRFAVDNDLIGLA